MKPYFTVKGSELRKMPRATKEALAEMGKCLIAAIESGTIFGKAPQGEMVAGNSGSDRPRRQGPPLGHKGSSALASKAGYGAGTSRKLSKP